MERLNQVCCVIYTGTQPQYRNQADSELLTLFPPTQEALHEIDEILKDQFGISLIDADDAKERVIPSKAQLVAAHPSSLGTHKQILQEAMTTTQDFSYALMFTINALQSCADVYWKHIAGENRQIMFLLLHVLQHRYAQLPSWIRNSMMKLVARLSLLYWRRLGLHRTLLQECQKFVGDDTATLRKLGFQLLEELVFAALQDHPSWTERRILRTLAVRDTLIRPSLELGLSHLRGHVQLSDLDDILSGEAPNHSIVLQQALFGSNQSVKGDILGFTGRLFADADAREEVTACLRLILTCLDLDLQNLVNKDSAIGGPQDDSPLIPPLTWKSMMQIDTLILFLRITIGILDRMHARAESLQKQLTFDSAMVQQCKADQLTQSMSHCLDISLQCAMQLMAVSRSLMQSESQFRKLRCSLCLATFSLLTGSGEVFDTHCNGFSGHNNVWLPSSLCWMFSHTLQSLTRMSHKIRASFSPTDLSSSPIFKAFVKSLGRFTRFIVTSAVGMSPEDPVTIFETMMKNMPEEVFQADTTNNLLVDTLSTAKNLSALTQRMWKISGGSVQNHKHSYDLQHPLRKILQATTVPTNAVVTILSFWGRFIDSILLITPARRACIAEEVPSVLLSFFASNLQYGLSKTNAEVKLCGQLPLSDGSIYMLWSLCKNVGKRDKSEASLPFDSATDTDFSSMFHDIAKLAKYNLINGCAWIMTIYKWIMTVCIHICRAARKASLTNGFSSLLKWCARLVYENRLWLTRMVKELINVVTVYNSRGYVNSLSRSQSLMKKNSSTQNGTDVCSPPIDVGDVELEHVLSQVGQYGTIEDDRLIALCLASLYVYSLCLMAATSPKGRNLSLADETGVVDLESLVEQMSGSLSMDSDTGNTVDDVSQFVDVDLKLECSHATLDMLCSFIKVYAVDRKRMESSLLPGGSFKRSTNPIFDPWQGENSHRQQLQTVTEYVMQLCAYESASKILDVTLSHILLIRDTASGDPRLIGSSMEAMKYVLEVLTEHDYTQNASQNPWESTNISVGALDLLQTDTVVYFIKKGVPPSQGNSWNEIKSNETICYCTAMLMFLYRSYLNGELLPAADADVHSKYDGTELLDDLGFSGREANEFFGSFSRPNATMLASRLTQSFPELVENDSFDQLFGGQKRMAKSIEAILLTDSGTVLNRNDVENPTIAIEESIRPIDIVPDGKMTESVSFLRTIYDIIGNGRSIAEALGYLKNALKYETGTVTETDACTILRWIRELCGIVKAVDSVNLYRELVGWLLEDTQILGLLKYILLKFRRHHLIVMSVLKFLTLLIQKRGPWRLSFRQNDPSGYKLLRLISEAISNSIMFMEAGTIGRSSPEELIKLQKLIIKLSMRSLDASFVNFGVMRLYNDTSAVEICHRCSQCLMSISPERLNVYPSLRYYYCFAIRALMTHDNGYGMLMLSPNYRCRLVHRLGELLKTGFPLEISQASVGLGAILKIAFRSLYTLRILQYENEWNHHWDELHERKLYAEQSILQKQTERCDISNANWMDSQEYKMNGHTDATVFDTRYAVHIQQDASFVAQHAINAIEELKSQDSSIWSDICFLMLENALLKENSDENVPSRFNASSTGMGGSRQAILLRLCRSSVETTQPVPGPEIVLWSLALPLLLIVVIFPEDFDNSSSIFSEQLSSSAPGDESLRVQNKIHSQLQLFKSNIVQAVEEKYGDIWRAKAAVKTPTKCTGFSPNLDSGKSSWGTQKFDLQLLADDQLFKMEFLDKVTTELAKVKAEIKRILKTVLV